MRLFEVFELSLDLRGNIMERYSRFPVHADTAKKAAVIYMKKLYETTGIDCVSLEIEGDIFDSQADMEIHFSTYRRPKNKE